MKRLADIGAELLSETLARLDEIEPREQSEEKATFAPVLSREDGLVEWALDAFQIERRVRGFQPWPNAYTSFQSRRLIIWRAAGENDSRAIAPGEVVEARGDKLSIACGSETVLHLQEVQPEGKKRLSARDFMNGVHLRAGEKFG